MYEPVDAPLPVPSPRSLLNVASVLGRVVEGTLSTTGETVSDQEAMPASRAGVARWVTDGVTYAQESCGAIEDDLTFCEGDEDYTDPSGSPTASGSVVTAEAARFRAGSRCSRMSGPGTRDEVRARAARMLGLWQHEAVARTFWTALSADAARITDATGLAVIDGLASVEEAMAGLSADPDADVECGPGQRALIHANPRTVTILAALGLVRQESGLLLTAMDSIIVSGYTGDGPAGQSAADASSAWVIGSGFVDVRLSPVLFSETVDREDNDVTVWASRGAVVTVGSCCSVSAQLDLTDRA